jgi:predicted small lipoprotein YifL
MKKLLALAITLVVAHASYAGCGLKVPVSGEVKAYNAEKKQLTVGDQAITLAAAVKITDAKGQAVKAADLVGKKVTVSTDKHNKQGESVTVAAAK